MTLPLTIHPFDAGLSTHHSFEMKVHGSQCDQKFRHLGKILRIWATFKSFKYYLLKL